MLSLLRVVQNEAILPLAAFGLVSLFTTTYAQTGSQPSAPNEPNFELALPTEMVPCAVHARASSPSPGTPGEGWGEGAFSWSFGDPKSASNDLKGFNAAHLYTTPGTYTIRCSDGAHESTRQITIQPDHRLKVFLSSAGNDANDGLTPQTPLATPQEAMKHLTDSSELLLHRGDVFDLTRSITIDKKNIVVGAYGDGSQPVLRKADARLNDLINVSHKAGDVVIEDLSFDSLYKASTEKSGGSRGVYVGGNNVAISDVTFRNVSDAVNAELSPHYLLIENCVAPSVTSIRGYLLWAQGSDIVVLNNKAPNSTREHIIRVGGADRVLVANNDFANIDRKNNGDKDDIAKGTIVFQKGSYLCAYNNHLTGGPLGIGPLGGPDGMRDPDARTSNVIVSNNTINGASFYINAGVAHALFEKNTIHYDGDVAFIIRPQDHASDVYARRTVQDLKIIGNTAENDAPTGRFLLLTEPTAPAAITVKDNAFIAPKYETGHHESAAMFILDSDLKSFAAIENNTWPAPLQSHPDGALFYIWPKWYDERGYLTIEQWGKLPQVKGDRCAP